jgi:hypothetical protein
MKTTERNLRSNSVFLSSITYYVYNHHEGTAGVKIDPNLFLNL